MFYTVTAEIDDAAVARRYVAWLLGGPGGAGSHAAEVIAWGGTRAEVCLLDAEEGAGPGGAADSAGATRVECRYEFPSRGALERYLREGAPALREEGRRLFLSGGGVRLSRRVGVLAGRVWARASG